MHPALLVQAAQRALQNPVGPAEQRVSQVPLAQPDRERPDHLDRPDQVEPVELPDRQGQSALLVLRAQRA